MDIIIQILLLLQAAQDGLYIVIKMVMLIQALRFMAQFGMTMLNVVQFKQMSPVVAL